MFVWTIFCIYAAVMSLIGLILYGTDKARAKRGAWRIPEKVLLGVSFFGGTGIFGRSILSDYCGR